MQAKTTHFFILLCCCYTSLFSQNGFRKDIPKPILIDRHHDGMNVLNNIDYFHDTASTETIQTLVAKSEGWLVPDTGAASLFMQPRGQYWVRFQMQNTDTVMAGIDIFAASQEIDKARLFTYSNGRIDSSKWSGGSIKYHDRPSFDADILFMERIPARSSVTYYFLMRCKDMPVQTPLGFSNIFNIKQRRDAKKGVLELGFSIGLLSTYGLLALLLFCLFPKWLHFWYAVYVISGTLYSVSAAGWGRTPPRGSSTATRKSVDRTYSLCLTASLFQSQSLLIDSARRGTDYR